MRSTTEAGEKEVFAREARFFLFSVSLWQVSPVWYPPIPSHPPISLELVLRDFSAFSAFSAVKLTSAQQLGSGSAVISVSSAVAVNSEKSRIIRPTTKFS